MAIKLSVDSSNRITTTSILNGTSNAATVTSVSAYIYKATDAARTPLVYSSVSMSTVTSSVIYTGIFPYTVPLEREVDYRIVLIVFADGGKRTREYQARASTT